MFNVIGSVGNDAVGAGVLAESVFPEHAVNISTTALVTARPRKALPTVLVLAFMTYSYF
jgi:hypothetical protein